MESDNRLQKLEAANRMLAECRTVGEVKEIADKAAAATVWAKRARLGLEAQNHAAEIKIRAERRAGELLTGLDRGKSPGRSGKKVSSDGDQSEYRQALDGCGITYQDANRWQKVAMLNEERFEALVATSRKDGAELTTGGLIRAIERGERKEAKATGSPSIVPLADINYTPEAAIRALFNSDVAPPKERPLIEPAAGDGAIIKVALKYGYTVKLAVEKREEEFDGLTKLCKRVHCGDWRNIVKSTQLALITAAFLRDSSIVTNPPYSIGAQFAAACFYTGAPYVALLLRLNVLGSATWKEIWNSPEARLTALRTLEKRPSFHDDGHTDAAEYGWFVWELGRVPMDVRMI